MTPQLAVSNQGRQVGGELFVFRDRLHRTITVRGPGVAVLAGQSVDHHTHPRGLWARGNEVGSGLSRITIELSVGVLGNNAQSLDMTQREDNVWVGRVRIRVGDVKQRARRVGRMVARLAQPGKRG
ncbi:hypothetical protein PHYPSEUDO_007262 [Phytophthora pseudosyringae]|uniref:Uncharacterized protein n=1 Tax=Phytophthora pseudosyringae TaxID=221518 RepID=A0A8T1VLU7_9STRA|nr:hypothetical protein PHYPSEUDO_007262 [Phytophthora pseudosyringae]